MVHVLSFEKHLKDKHLKTYQYCWLWNYKKKIPRMNVQKRLMCAYVYKNQGFASETLVSIVVTYHLEELTP
jgi:hypothetical protein